MGKNSIPGSLCVFTPLHDSSRGEGLPEPLVAALVLALVGGVPIRESAAQCIDEDAHNYNTDCIQLARVSGELGIAVMYEKTHDTPLLPQLPHELACLLRKPIGR